MKKNKILKIVLIILLLVMFFINIGMTVQAWTPDFKQFDNVSGGETDKAATNIVGALINVVTTLGAGLAIVMLIVLGIRYITAAGSAEKALVKRGLGTYVAGVVLIFGAIGILKLVQMFIDKNINDI